MNNNENFKKWMQDLDESDMKDINRIIEKTVRTSKRKRMSQRWIISSLTIVVTVMLLFVGLVNFNDSFYVFASESPFLKPWTQLVNGRQDILRAFDTKFVQKIDQSIIAGDFELILDSMISDSRYVNLFYKVKYQGQYLDFDKNDFNSSIGFEKTNGESMSLGYQLGNYKDYWWREIYLSGSNSYAGFRVTFKPYGEKSDIKSSYLVNIDPVKIVKTLNKDLKKTIQIEGQKVILDRLEIGAFQSRLIYHNSEDNEKIIQQLVFENSKGAKIESQKDISDNIEFTDFEAGQINPPARFNLKIIHASILEKKFETVEFSPQTQKFTDLPDYLTLIQVDKKGINYSITLKNSTGQGTFLYPKSANAIDLGDKWISAIGETWMSFTITDDQQVIFNVMGGKKVIDLPYTISLNFREIILRK
ncbi:MAG: DUF4179 domain-containing protein [Erysipelotrichaceae bacterium]